MSNLTKPTYLDHGKEAKDLSIVILAKDKTTGQIIGEKVITKGQLAKFFQPLTDHAVVGSKNGKFVIEF